jgi:hypothetical protein
MLDLEIAMKVTADCIRLTAGLPPSSPVAPEVTLLRLGIDNLRVDVLKRNIAGDARVGLPGLNPPRRINVELLAIDEGSTVDDVLTIVARNAVIAKPRGNK